MNLKPRRTEEPEINVTSLIDVVLLLVVFFMLSSNFTAEGRLRIRLPQASNQAPERAAADAARGHRQRRRCLPGQWPGAGQFQPRHAARRHPQERRGCHAHRAGHDPCRWARQPSIRGHGHGRARSSGIHADERCHSHRDPKRDRLEATRAGQSLPARSNIEQARGVYRRLLRYARPYTGIYLLGVLGMVLYAGTDLLTITFTKSYLTSALALEQHRQVLEWLPLAVLGIFAGTWTAATTWPTTSLSGWAARSSSRSAATCSRITCGCRPRSTTASHPARCCRD